MEFYKPVFLALENIFLSLCRHSFELFASLIAGVCAYVITLHFIPSVRIKLLDRRIYGIDINKTTPQKRKEMAGKRYNELCDEEKPFVIPESLGILAGSVYLGVVVLLLTITYGSAMKQIDGAIVTISVMLLLGFVDDVLDLRWRYKLLLSTIGSLPLLLSYDGSLCIAIPRILLPYFSQPFVCLGVFYLVYLLLLCVFCTNSINILAGVNGVEVSQSIVLAITCVVYNIIQLRLEGQSFQHNNNNNSDNVLCVGNGDFNNSSFYQLIPIALLTPFIGVSFALWRYNRYPASIFVGDSYTYFAGTVLVVAGVFGQYGKTLLLFFTPQAVNFILSLPQLLNIIPCPRHRVPMWNSKKDVLQNSGNYTLLNAILWIYGDMNERLLARFLLKILICCSVLSLFVRYTFASYLYDCVR